MTFFYVVTNENKNEPDVVRKNNYIHIKSKADGSQTAILTEDEIIDPSCAACSQSDLQTVLDSWIDAENTPPLDLDVNGDEIKQSYINVGIYLD